jgi:hypothetical protein
MLAGKHAKETFQSPGGAIRDTFPLEFLDLDGDLLHDILTHGETVLLADGPVLDFAEHGRLVFRFGIDPEHDPGRIHLVHEVVKFLGQQIDDHAFAGLLDFFD